MRRGVAVLLAVLTLAAPAGAFTRHATLDDTASWLALRPVSVHCQSAAESAADPVVVYWGASGYVDVERNRQGKEHPANHTVFAHGICEALVALMSGNAGDHGVGALAWAVLVLAHESGHLRGHAWWRDEAKTQRWALRHFVATAVHLGIEEPAARLLLRFAVQHHRELDRAYLTPGCRKPWVDATGVLRACK